MMRPNRRSFVAVYLLVFVSFASLAAQEVSVRPGINDSFRDPEVVDFVERFEGESREVFVERAAIADACRLRPGMVVADVGAGTGLFTRLFAERVGAEGRVVAVDIAAKFLDHIEQTARAAGLRNVETVLGTDESTNLPPDSVDLVFICDTYHHFEYPERMMTSIQRALRPGGRLVVVDFVRIPGESSEWVLGHVRAGQEEVEGEIAACGFRQTETELESLAENYLIEFVKVPAADAAGNGSHRP